MIVVFRESNTGDVRTQVQAHHESAFHWALCCCRGDRLEAEEVLQTAYVKLLDGTARFGGTSSFKTWLFAVIRNTAAEVRRKTLLRRVILGSRCLELTPSCQVEEPDSGLERAAVREHFLRALQALPARQHQVLELVFGQDLKLREAADVMGISVGAASRHYERGKQRMRVLLADLERDDAARAE